MKIGILEQGKRSRNENSLTTIEDIIEYALKADELGFSRFWLTEHHYSFVSHSYSNPDILISIIAGMTENISVGSAGVLVNLYPPLSVISNYKLMNNLFHDRIDLGLANSLTDIPYVNKMCNQETKDVHFSEIFKKNVTEMSALIHNEEKYFRDEGVVIPPFKGVKPNLWYLATSYKSSEFVIKNKLNLCRSIFHNRGQKLHNVNYDKDQLIKFKHDFKERNGFNPKISLSLAFYMSESLSQSRNVVDNMSVTEAGINQSPYVVIPTTPTHFYDLLYDYKDKFGIEEFILYDLGRDNQKKIENLQITSEMFNLKSVVMS
ncbi:LLM class flavin-dependent oxidoreductase [Aquimarina sp. 2201CG1-2-11]|uniref:LLM class flavin-dependent oxidoreductase n=1 Tax=Aquimarina discodermiae TaxID=3231043 RepID=UPI003461F64A